MSKLLVRGHAPDPSGCVASVTPQSAGWKHVGFKAYRLVAGQALRGDEAARETCVVVLTGTATVATGGRRYEGLGGRHHVFEDKAPGAVYIPASMPFEVSSDAGAEIALCTAPAPPGGEPRQLDPARMSQEVRGSGTNTRYVRNILPQTEPAASLLVVEVITPGGHWSSYPPHKHDTSTAGEETALEETYYHRLNPPQGFAVQRVYTDDRSLDETCCVQDGDVVMVPRGYHPVGAAHGYDLYYLNVMAGPERQWIFRNDPAHEWMLRKR
jgi:5-deoxy-glucuronate isomerase